MEPLWVRQVPSNVSAEDSIWLKKHVHFIDWEVLTIDVAARASDGHPTVLRMYPLRVDPKGRGSGEPVPWVNLYFLVCPKLVQSVGRLEQAGYIDIFDKRVEENDAFAKSLVEDHKLYAEQRWSLLSNADKEYAERKKYTTTLRETGICGMKYFKRVKCLHAHYGFYLASSKATLVGRWVEQLLKNEERGTS